MFVKITSIENADKILKYLCTRKDLRWKSDRTSEWWFEECYVDKLYYITQFYLGINAEQNAPYQLLFYDNTSLDRYGTQVRISDVEYLKSVAKDTIILLNEEV